ncbi:MAG: hypothetical protein U0930_11800 [Pirellulales bacterium]
MSNTNKIHVTLPEGLSSNEAESWLREHWQLFRDALDLIGDYFDRKSQVESTDIVSVEVDGTQVQVQYRVEYSGFRACQDLRYSEQSTRHIVGKLVENAVVFDRYEPIERRSTADEL